MKQRKQNNSNNDNNKNKKQVEARNEASQMYCSRRISNLNKIE